MITKCSRAATRLFERYPAIIIWTHHGFWKICPTPTLMLCIYQRLARGHSESFFSPQSKKFGTNRHPGASRCEVRNPPQQHILKKTCDLPRSSASSRVVSHLSCDCPQG